MARPTKVLAEERPAGGRLAWLDDNARVAGILKKSDNYLLVDELSANYVPIPFTSLERKGTFSLPPDHKFDFLGKDITTFVHEAWNVKPMPGGKTIERRMARALGTYDWVLSEKPDAVVVWTDAYPEMRAAVLAAKDIGVPSFEIVHGGFHFLAHGHFETKRFVDYSLGSWEFRRWHQLNKCSSEMVPTGSTQMDVWARGNIDVLRQKARAQMKIPNSGVVVCYLEDAAFERTPWSDEAANEQTLYKFLEAFKLLGTIVEDPFLVLKLHPYAKNHNPHEREKLLHKFGIKDNYTIIDDNLPMSLAASDLTIGHRSTAMIEGFMLGIPAVVLAFEPFFEQHLYEGFGFEIVRNPNDILSKMVGLLANQEVMLSKIDETDRGARFFGSDGLASLRAVRVIDKVLRGEELGESDYGTLPE